MAERIGFAIVNVTPEKMVCRRFGWREPQAIKEIDTLKPHATVEVGRHA